MAKTVNWKSFWVPWAVIFVFLVLLCAMIAVTVFTVGWLLKNLVGAYLVSGLLTYVTNPRFWVLENGQKIPYQRDIWVIFLWPIKLPGYIGLMLAVAVMRWVNK